MIATETKDTVAIHADHSKIYLITLVSLLIITVIEYFFGFMDTSGLKITILVAFSIIKAGFIITVFMHVKYNKDWKIILLLGIVVPLILTTYLFFFIYSDFDRTVLP